MEETHPNKIDLTLLGKHLYQCLHQDAIAAHPLQVNCEIKEETLIITLQVAAYPALEIPATISCIRDFLDHYILSSIYPAKLYLTLHSNSPAFSWEQPDLNTRFLESIPLQQTINALAQRATPTPALFTSQRPRRLVRIPSHPVSGNFPLKIFVGLGLGLGVVIVGLIALNDPCVVGNCPNLAKAEFIAQNSLINLQPNSSTSLLATKQQLNEAIQLLESVPWWSRFSGEANRLTADYQTLVQELNLLNRVTNQEEQVKQLMQKAPLPVSEWRTAQSLVQANLVFLQQFPAQSAFAGVAIAKQQEAKQLLSSINQRLLQEQTATSSYEKAMETAQLAKIQEKTAKSLADYDAIAGTWQKAIQNLQNIAEGTSPYKKALKSLQVYGQEYQNVVLRKTQEEAAQLSYQQAIQEANLAEKAEMAKQWSTAVNHWKNALTNLKQIPQNTLQAIKATPLITNYTLSLKQAQSNFNKTNRLQVIKQSLDKICSQQGKACDYSINAQGIKVRLTSIYLQKIWNLSIQAKLQSNVNNQAEILNHISRLEQSFQIISNQAGLPLQVYNSQGNLMTTYNPLP